MRQLSCIHNSIITVNKCTTSEVEKPINFDSHFYPSKHAFQVSMQLIFQILIKKYIPWTRKDISTLTFMKGRLILNRYMCMSGICVNLMNTFEVVKEITLYFNDLIVATARWIFLICRQISHHILNWLCTVLRHRWP